jgi:hypothetical protein
MKLNLKHKRIMKGQSHNSSENDLDIEEINRSRKLKPNCRTKAELRSQEQEQTKSQNCKIHKLEILVNQDTRIAQRIEAEIKQKFED